MWAVNFPRWVVISIYREYMAVMIILIPIRKIDGLDQENVDMTMKSSPIRLMSGGRARFAKLARNHHVAISGKII